MTLFTICFVVMVTSVGATTPRPAGKCVATFGPSCERVCHCKINSACNTTTGSCSKAGGCARGWISATGQDNCQQICPNGTYGYGCRGTCGCATKRPCRKTDGACMDGKCAKEYPYQQKLLDGKILCVKNEIPKCNCREMCDHTTGLCPWHCASGWLGDYNQTVHQWDCKHPCPTESYGYRCARHCHCKDNKLCNHVTGSCGEAGGCQPYWKSGPADSSCQIPKCLSAFGPCCEKDCHCRINYRCNKITGSCKRAFGCGTGWRSAPGRDDCQLKCPPGTYGLGCKKKSRCLTVAAARHTDGACMDDKGCAPKYKGSYKDRGGFTRCLPFSLSILEKLFGNRGK